MSILGFLLKPKREMAKKRTKYVRVGKYHLTSHAQNRIVQKDRATDKVDVLDNLFTKPNCITKVEYKKGKPSYDRVGKRITTSINPTNNNVATCRPVSKKEIKQFGLINVGKKGGKKKYVKRKSYKQIYAESERRGKKTFR